MKQLALALLLFSVAPAFATPIPSTLVGTLADGGTFAGNLTYDPAVVIATGVHGWANVEYAVSAFDVTVDPTWSLAPDTVRFLDSRSLVEYCVGVCTFGGPDGTSVRFADGNNSLQLSWIGDTLQSSTFRVALIEPYVGSVGMELVRTASLRPTSVPEPEAIWLLITGLVGLGIVLWLAWAYGEDLAHG